MTNENVLGQQLAIVPMVIYGNKLLNNFGMFFMFPSSRQSSKALRAAKKLKNPSKQKRQKNGIAFKRNR